MPVKKKKTYEISVFHHPESCWANHRIPTIACRKVKAAIGMPSIYIRISKSSCNKILHQLAMAHDGSPQSEKARIKSCSRAGRVPTSLSTSCHSSSGTELNGSFRLLSLTNTLWLGSCPITRWGPNGYHVIQSALVKQLSLSPNKLPHLSKIPSRVATWPVCCILRRIRWMKKPESE